MKRLALFIISIFILTYFIPISKTDSPEIVPIKKEWVKKDSKRYARDVMFDWTNTQFKCLDELWYRESRWETGAYNKIKVMGKNAGGIPQLLGMSIDTAPTRQIERGWNYILYRYGSACHALLFHNKNGWY